MVEKFDEIDEHENALVSVESVNGIADEEHDLELVVDELTEKDLHVIDAIDDEEADITDLLDIV